MRTATDPIAFTISTSAEDKEKKMHYKCHRHHPIALSKENEGKFVSKTENMKCTH